MDTLYVLFVSITCAIMGIIYSILKKNKIQSENITNKEKTIIGNNQQQTNEEHTNINCSKTGNNKQTCALHRTESVCNTCKSKFKVTEQKSEEFKEELTNNISSNQKEVTKINTEKTITKKEPVAACELQINKGTCKQGNKIKTSKQETKLLEQQQQQQETVVVPAKDESKEEVKVIEDKGIIQGTTKVDESKDIAEQKSKAPQTFKSDEQQPGTILDSNKKEEEQTVEESISTFESKVAQDPTKLTNNKEPNQKEVETAETTPIINSKHKEAGILSLDEDNVSKENSKTRVNDAKEIPNVDDQKNKTKITGKKPETTDDDVKINNEITSYDANYVEDDRHNDLGTTFKNEIGQTDEIGMNIEYNKQEDENPPLHKNNNVLELTEKLEINKVESTNTKINNDDKQVENALLDEKYNENQINNENEIADENKVIEDDKRKDEISPIDGQDDQNQPNGEYADKPKKENQSTTLYNDKQDNSAEKENNETLETDNVKQTPENKVEDNKLNQNAEITSKNKDNKIEATDDVNIKYDKDKQDENSSLYDENEDNNQIESDDIKISNEQDRQKDSIATLYGSVENNNDLHIAIKNKVDHIEESNEMKMDNGDDKLDKEEIATKVDDNVATKHQQTNEPSTYSSLDAENKENNKIEIEDIKINDELDRQEDPIASLDGSVENNNDLDIATKNKVDDFKKSNEMKVDNGDDKLDKEEIATKVDDNVETKHQQTNEPSTYSSLNATNEENNRIEIEDIKINNEQDRQEDAMASLDGSVENNNDLNIATKNKVDDIEKSNEMNVDNGDDKHDKKDISTKVDDNIATKPQENKKPLTYKEEISDNEDQDNTNEDKRQDDELSSDETVKNENNNLDNTGKHEVYNVEASNEMKIDNGDFKPEVEKISTKLHDNNPTKYQDTEELDEVQVLSKIENYKEDNIGNQAKDNANPEKNNDYKQEDETSPLDDNVENKNNNVVHTTTEMKMDTQADKQKDEEISTIDDNNAIKNQEIGESREENICDNEAKDSTSSESGDDEHVNDNSDNTEIYSTETDVNEENINDGSKYKDRDNTSSENSEKENINNDCNNKDEDSTSSESSDEEEKTNDVINNEDDIIKKNEILNITIENQEEFEDFVVADPKYSNGGDTDDDDQSEDISQEQTREEKNPDSAENLNEKDQKENINREQTTDVKNIDNLDSEQNQLDYILEISKSTDVILGQIMTTDITGDSFNSFDSALTNNILLLDKIKAKTSNVKTEKTNGITKIVNAQTFLDEKQNK